MEEDMFRNRESMRSANGQREFGYILDLSTVHIWTLLVGQERTRWMYVPCDINPNRFCAINIRLLL
jgi:hypothetical protein